jgi:zinc finger SWIM domain-containing protein 3
LRKFVYGWEGFHEREAKHMKKEKKEIKPWDISCVGCKAKMVIARGKESWRWYVKAFIDGHNHPLATRDLAFLLQFTLKDYQ